jgi:hypothetical protein
MNRGFTALSDHYGTKKSPLTQNTIVNILFPLQYNVDYTIMIAEPSLLIEVVF